MISEVKILNMETIVTEMYENFIMSEACSRYYALVGDDDDAEAQNFPWYIDYMEHASQCKKASKACLNFLKTKNLIKLVIELKRLGLYEDINVIKTNYNEIKQ